MFMRLAAVVAACFAVTHLAAAKPNVIVILTDDQGWGDLSVNGNTNLRTPHLDSLARDGAMFERFFVQPVCSPTRAEFLTGRYHPRGGVRGVTSGGERLNLDERTVAESFQKAGYATAAFGKWHNGSQYPYHPRGRGFGEYFGFTAGHWADYFDAPLDHDGKDVKGKGYLPDELTDRTIAFAKKATAAGTPFFVYLTYNTPHSPMQVPDEYWARYEKAELKLRGATGKENVEHTRAALAMCENIDRNVGRLLTALHDQKIEEDTMVIYFADNGPNGPRWNGGMKGVKGTTDEGGVRSPLHVRWPGRVKPGTVVKPVAAAIDLMPTLLALAGVPRVGEKPLDGIDLSPWLLGKGTLLPDRVLFQTWAGRVSARTQRYRLDNAGKLFDMIDDPNQTRDVSGDKPDEAKKLRDAVTTWKTDVGVPQKADDRPFPVGHKDWTRAVIPARDGVPVGGVKRSASAPNCSYFTNWTTTKDAMTWSVEVAEAGRYDAVVNYTCAAADVGSTVELKLGDAAWTGTVAEAFESPLRGKEIDRVNRGAESYMKDFRPLSLGTVTLPKGRGTLTLRATNVAGKAVADVRAVELIRKP
jgi:arylsulfatase A-like enzyme